jgi:hypothetical protein
MLNLMTVGNQLGVIGNKILSTEKIYIIPFSPTDIIGLKLWLDAGQGVTKDGSNYVSQWADQSGNGNNASQGTAANQPLYVASGLNSKPVISFDGINDYLIGTVLPIGAGSFTVFIIQRLRTTTHTASCSFLISIAGVSKFSLYMQYTDYYAFSFSKGLYINSSPSAYNNVFFLWETTKILNTSITQHINGSQKSTSTNATITSSFVDDKYYLNYYVEGSIGEYDIAEVLVYDSALSDTDRQRVENYLNTKYNIY